MIPKYSLIVPVYNEEENIPTLYKRLSAVMDKLDGLSELIFINDGSKDTSINQIRELHQQDERISFLSLARNFGHQIALTAGLHYASGEAIIILDADLQDPPELIPSLIQKWKEGNHVVYAQRTYRHKESIFKRSAAFIFYRILKNLSDVHIPTDTGDFALLDRKIVDLLNSMPERHRFIRGLRSWVGFNQTAVQFERDPRFAGEVKYTLSKLVGLAFNGLLSFSRLPLRFSTYVGFISAIIAIIMAIMVLYWRLFQPNSQFTGYATVMIAVFFIGAVQLISLGIMGEYLGRIYEEVKQRPLYTLNEIGGLSSKIASSRRVAEIVPDVSNHS